HEQLVEFDDDTLSEALHDTLEDPEAAYFPTIGQFKQRCVHARRRNAPTPVVSSIVPEADREYGIEMSDLIQTVLDMQQPEGVDRATWITDQVQQLRVERGIGAHKAPPPEPNCVRCMDTLYEETAPGSFIPCETCHSKSYERWAAGHYLPGHQCRECKRVREGKSPRPKTKDQDKE
ncbi:MAG: hypothetical protein ACREF4_20965, partial [Gammaproteobacteria bacterium]